MNDRDWIKHIRVQITNDPDRYKPGSIFHSPYTGIIHRLTEIDDVWGPMLERLETVHHWVPEGVDMSEHIKDADLTHIVERLGLPTTNSFAEHDR